MQIKIHKIKQTDNGHKHQKKKKIPNHPETTITKTRIKCKCRKGRTKCLECLRMT